MSSLGQDRNVLILYIESNRNREYEKDLMKEVLWIVELGRKDE
ncbi:hypothetical protein VFMJ11_B0173 (plasmid) [Aliivibrio fischeri MJ11]|uniref:Uncharacterized protein n=1 Tax=Aliivibrio fischeri (strain MJ11) TaxID=388396 RepID=B5EWB6_ALIFM|nr:hypothetical protein VFMJ11_B0173 [Aliivibrio fischeri MJ11]